MTTIKQMALALVVAGLLTGGAAAAERPGWIVQETAHGYKELVTRLGDAIKANFGVPLPRTSETEIGQDAQNAVLCALEMEQEMHKLNSLHEERGLPTVGMRIGIATGSVVAGSVGSSQRLKYTTVGDTINAAARLESLDREIVQDSPGRRPCRILIGERTYHYLDDRVETELVGEVRVKGKEQPLIVYRVVGLALGKPSATAHGEGAQT